MANSIIRPTFTNEADRLLFLSRLWRTPITALDADEWQAHKLLRTPKLEVETHRQFYERDRVWDDGRLARPAFHALSKWDSYGLGKIWPAAETAIGNKESFTLAQARLIVKAQLLQKQADLVVGLDIDAELTPLVTGLVW